MGLAFCARHAHAQSAADASFRAGLALRYGPIHHQDVHTRGAHSLGGAADYITAVDFDGDDDASNNWDNAGDARFPLAAHAYFSVVESATHWFITYLFFHPRDWSSSFFETEHENDSEGVLITVARDGSQFGSLRAAVTVVHSDFYSFLPTGSRWSSGRESVDGALTLSPFMGDLHPVTAQQAETHALKAWPYYRIRRQGVVYYPSLTEAEVPASPDDRQVMYRLHDMLEPSGLWARRESSKLFARFGVFAGNRSGGCGQSAFWCSRNAARVSWGWNDHDDQNPTGAMASDPAALVRGYFGSREQVSQSYLFNPFR
ncbi:MAG: hypothetical protein EOO73_23385 [Myxococcales bacterium]|nr:MAG: hypothetical protein EOO73_23385 [Myxococcales bacterium]